VRETKLHIHWDGFAPGLAEHRLSLDAFGPALVALLSAVRRIASGIVKDALEDPNYGRKGGRLARKAQLIDLELAGISGGSLGVDLLCRMRVAPGANMPLFEELPERATNRLLDAIESEGRGQPANALVRRYLSRLPEGVVGQRYDITRDGTSIRSVALGSMALPRIEPGPPYLVQLDGAIVGLGLDPDAPEVRIASNERKYTCAATMAQVERAIELRQEPVRAMILHTKGARRLLWIRPMRQPGVFADPDARASHLLTSWDELLKRLAQ
jgi:hypothetical protein